MCYSKYFRQKKRSKLGIITGESFLVFSTVFMLGIEQKESFYNESDIIEDSEIGYVEAFHPVVVWHRNGEPPTQIEYLAVCKKEKVYITYKEIWAGDKKEEISRKKANLKKYLNLWKNLEKYDVWNLESPMEILARIKSSEEDPYEDTSIDHEWLKFVTRIRNKEHKFDVYNIDGLKDKRYKRILDEMDKFFGIKRKIIKE